MMDSRSPIRDTKHDAPIYTIEDLILQLEKVTLSPLPCTDKDIQLVQKEITSNLKKIVFNFDVILLDKLKTDCVDLSRNNLDVHYWSYLSKYFQIPSVKFCNFSDKLTRPGERGMTWISISITEKSFNESIKEIYQQKFHQKYYDETSLMVTRRSDILVLSEKICKIHLFDVKTDFDNEYSNYKRVNVVDNEREDLNRDEMDLISPIRRKFTDKNYIITPYTLDPNSVKDPTNLKQNTNSMYFSKATLDLQSMQPGDLLGLDVERGTTIDNIFNAMDRQYQDEDDNLNAENLANEENELVQEKSYPKKTQFYFPNTSKRRVSDGSQEEKIAKSFKQKKAQMNTETVNVYKFMDIQNIYKEKFYTFSDDKQGKTLELAYSTKTDSASQRQHPGAQKMIRSFIQHEKNFQISRKFDKNFFTKKDVIYYKNKVLKLTNSNVFYLNYFYKKEPYIRFNTQITSSQPVTIESQNYQCAFCRRIFESFLFIPTTKINWCSYYLRYVCEDCISNEYSIIPGFILNFWNFHKFPISKQAKNFLSAWYDKPVIHIKRNDVIIRESSILHMAIVLKRKIHKIFDLMKCENADAFVINTLGSYKYLVLRENLFSLKDLVEISDQKMIQKLRELLEKFEDHIRKDCSICLYKGGICVMCMNEEIIYAYDVENVLFCNECKKMFHKKCCSFHPCIINR